jgi:predicted RNase H-like HicB family nuclease
MNRSEKYPAQVYWDERDRGYVAIAPDLPGCSAFGTSRAKALRELDQAVEAWIGTARDEGRSLPAPSPPSPSGQYSGRVLLRLPASLHEQLARTAEQEGVSLNQWLVTLLASEGALRTRWRPATRLRERPPHKSSATARRRRAR